LNTYEDDGSEHSAAKSADNSAGFCSAGFACAVGGITVYDKRYRFAASWRNWWRDWISPELIWTARPDRHADASARGLDERDSGISVFPDTFGDCAAFF